MWQNKGGKIRRKTIKTGGKTSGDVGIRRKRSIKMCRNNCSHNANQTEGEGERESKTTQPRLSPWGSCGRLSGYHIVKPKVFIFFGLTTQLGLPCGVPRVKPKSGCFLFDNITWVWHLAREKGNNQARLACWGSCGRLFGNYMVKPKVIFGL